MSRDITFIPLGGGQSVGASCYYLQIGDTKVILDAGTGMKEGMEFEPKFHSLLTSPFLQSMNQISQIFISHAHADHVGYLLRLMKQSTYANVCMTEITKTLAECFQERFEELGGEIVGTDNYMNGDPDFSAQIDKFMNDDGGADFRGVA